MRRIITIAIIAALCLTVAYASQSPAGGLGRQRSMKKQIKRMTIKLKKRAEEMTGKTFDMFKAKSYKTQVVAGVIYYVKTHPANETELPLIFVGGVPRSGTTLMRTILEAHGDIRCGPETRVVPAILIERRKWRQTTSHIKQLEEAGVEPVALDIAVAKFMLEIIKKHAPPATFYCNKDPLALIETASVLTYWNRATERIYKGCQEIGEDVCLPVHYEQLVLQPIKTTKKIFKFLDIDWCSDVLHHEKHINTTNLSKFERSTEQVQRPLYLDALTSWFGKIPPDVQADMPKIAPMLSKLGYDPYNPEPTYGEPDDFVLGKSNY